MPAQEFNGNECRALLKSFREGKVTLNGEGADLFLAASHVQDFAAARDLSPDEIEELDVCITKLFQVIRNYPNFTIANKLHCLECHVIDFVKKYGSWGRFSEQCKGNPFVVSLIKHFLPF